MNERDYEVKGDLTTGLSFAASKGRELRANEVGVVLKSHSLVYAQVTLTYRSSDWPFSWVAHLLSAFSHSQ
jgi:hypothetical protein